MMENEKLIVNSETVGAGPVSAQKNINNTIKPNANAVGCAISRPQGITLIALIITIIIMLILAGVVLNLTLGEHGIFKTASNASVEYIKADMKEKLQLALFELQTEKQGNATLDDVTEEYLQERLKPYEVTLTTDASTSGKIVTIKKEDITVKYLIDKDLNITPIDVSGINITYEAISRNGNNVTIKIIIEEQNSGISQIQMPDGSIKSGNGQKKIEEQAVVEIGKSYKIKVITVNGEEKEQDILIDNYYQTITKNLAEGISIDNKDIKAAYNKPYNATISANEGYIIENITLTMDGQNIVVDKNTGIINIERVTGDIQIQVTSRKIEIQIGAVYVNTSQNATSSANANSIDKNQYTLYVNFTATLEGVACTIEPPLSQSITKNGTYTYTITGVYNGKTITTTKEVVVNQYKSAVNIVQYNAGEWTKEEIEELDSKKLYDINKDHVIGNGTFKAEGSGINLTFGGFTYKGDTTNQTAIDSGKVITSRNESVSPQADYGAPMYNGWQILETEEIDGKVYVKKIIHAGSPENFVHNFVDSYDGARAEYILSSGIRRTTYNTTSNGASLNARNWDMYKDKNQLDIIEEIHCITKEESQNAVKEVRLTGGYYWTSYSNGISDLTFCNNIWGVETSYGHTKNIGIRPVVTMKDGVYIKSGDGTEASPYVLGKD